MSTMSSAAAAAALLLMLTAAEPAKAQYADSGTGWYAYECPRRDDESMFAWVQRCEPLVGQKAKAEQREADKRRTEYLQMKARLMDQPALPAARNRLIGRWTQAARPPATSRATDPMAQLLGQALDGCALLFGDGATVEFRADRYLVTDSYGTDDLGGVAYREGQQGVVVVMPKVGVELMAMQLETADRFRVINSPTPCVMTRVGLAAGPDRDPGPAATRAPSTPAPTPAPATPARALLTFSENSVGYQCPNGQKPIVISCEEGSSTIPALCKVLNAEKPLTSGGFQMTDIEPRSALAARVSGCRTQKVSADSKGNLKFDP